MARSFEGSGESWIHPERQRRFRIIAQVMATEVVRESGFQVAGGLMKAAFSFTLA
jgi:hypothetical protein